MQIQLDGPRIFCIDAVLHQASGSRLLGPGGKDVVKKALQGFEVILLFCGEFLDSPHLGRLQFSMIWAGAAAVSRLIFTQKLWAAFFAIHTDTSPPLCFSCWCWQPLPYWRNTMFVLRKRAAAPGTMMAALRQTNRSGLMMLESKTLLTVCLASVSHSCLFPLVAMCMPVTDASWMLADSQPVGTAPSVPGNMPAGTRVMMEPMSNRASRPPRRQCTDC